MEWEADGLLLGLRRFGENDALAEVFTRDKGRVRGFVKGGTGHRLRSTLQVGNRLRLRHRSRTEEQLGRMTVELIESPLGDILGHRGRLAGLRLVAALLQEGLPESEPHPSLYDGMLAVMTVIRTGELAQIAGAVARLELAILSEQGYGLDLSECAVSGAKDGLVFVSPKTGRAVTHDVGRPYAKRLLALPNFLTEGGTPEIHEAQNAMRLSGYFLDRHIWVMKAKGAPKAREQFTALLHIASD